MLGDVDIACEVCPWFEPWFDVGGDLLSNDLVIRIYRHSLVAASAASAQTKFVGQNMSGTGNDPRDKTFGTSIILPQIPSETPVGGTVSGP